MSNSYNLKMKSLIILFAIVALPLNFFYALMYVLGFLPKIPMMGYATLIHIVSPILIFFFISKYKIFLNIKYFYLFMFFLIQVLVCTIVGYFFSDYAYNLDAFAQSIILFYYLFIYSVLSFSLFYYKFVGSNKIFVLLCAFLFVVIFLFFRNGEFSFYFHLMNPNVQTINYQEVSAIFLFIWFFYYCGVKETYKRLFSIAIAFLILIASGARTEFYGFIVALAYTFLLGNVRLNFNKIKILLLSFFCVFIIAFYFKDFIFEIIENSRQFTVTNLDNDNSWQEREFLKQKNLNMIWEYPVFGNYASHFEIGRGSYIHNIMSSWQQYGLVGFLLYFLLVFIPFLVMSYERIKTDNKMLDGYVFITTYAFIVIMITKSVYWSYFGLSIGAFMFFCWSYKKYLVNGGKK